MSQRRTTRSDGSGAGRAASADSAPIRGCARPSAELPVRRPLDLAEHLDLGLEHDAEAPRARGGGPPPSARGCRRWSPSPVVLDEVRVLGGEARTADPEAAAAGRVEQLAGRAALGPRVVGVLEGRAEGLDPGGLRLAALRPASPASVALISSGSPGCSRKEAPRDDLALAEVGAAVGEAELVGSAALGALGRCRSRPIRGCARARRRRRWRSSAPPRRRCRGC